MEFTAGGDTYQYDVDALTGKIIEIRMDVAQASRQQNAVTSSQPSQSKEPIGEEKAKKIALAQV